MPAVEEATMPKPSPSRVGWLGASGTIAMAFFIVAGIVILSSVMVNARSPDGPPRAAIIDQLSYTDRNPSFMRTVTGLLQAAGYEVSYYPPQVVTVDMYRNLPRKGYSLVILRGHSGLVPWEADNDPHPLLFTTEEFTFERHVDDIRARTLGQVSLVDRAAEAETFYFGVGPTFVEHRMKGKFRDTMVIVMGCEGLATEELATAFHGRGAGAFVGWSGDVTAEHTDRTTERLLRHLTIGGLPVREAVERTMSEMGPDPVFDADLKLYTPGE
jgi:hypothetical protein